MVDEQGRHGLDRHDMIDHAGVGCTLRHATLRHMVVLGLSQGQPAMLLDPAHAECAIAADTGQDDADGLVAAVLRKRRKKRVYGAAMLARRSRRDHSEDAILDGQRGIGWDDENAVLAYGNAVRGLQDRDGGTGTEQLDQQALVMGIEVLHQNEGHPAIGRRIGQERLERREAAGRGANANDKGGARESRWIATRKTCEFGILPASNIFSPYAGPLFGGESAGLSPTLSPLLCASEPRWLACAIASLASRRCRGRTGRHQGVSSRVGLIWCRHQREQAGPSARGANRERAPDFGNALAH